MCSEEGGESCRANKLPALQDAMTTGMFILRNSY